MKAAILLCLLLAGCATTPAGVDFDRVCAFQPLGAREGLAFARVICATPEQK